MGGCARAEIRAVYVVLDGFEATKRIREFEQCGELPDHLPIIALTANVTQESEGECRAAGMDHFLPKPLRMTGESSCAFLVSGWLILCLL